MKEFVSDNVPRKHIEQQIAEKKKAFECSLNPSKFAQKYQLTKHIVALHENKKPFECSLCPYKCVRKGKLDEHIAIVHEKKKPFKCNFVILALDLIPILKFTEHQFMRRRSPSNVEFVATASPKRVSWIDILIQSMRIRSLSNVTFVATAAS